MFCCFVFFFARFSSLYRVLYHFVFVVDVSTYNIYLLLSNGILVGFYAFQMAYSYNMLLYYDTLIEKIGQIFPQW